VITTSEKLFWGVEEVVGRIGHTHFLIEVIGIATVGWRLPTVCVELLDSRGAREYAIAIVANNLDEKPRNGISIGRTRCDSDFAIHSAAVFRLPARSSGMLARRLALIIEELRIGSFESPIKLRRFTFAGVNLIPSRVELNDKLLVDWRPKERRDLRILLSDNRKRKNASSRENERGACRDSKRDGCECANASLHRNSSRGGRSL
jgi:hypothetical protein